MEAWIVALVSGGIALLASLLTTFLNARNAGRNLRYQLQSEERRYLGQIELEERKRQDQRQADARTRLFEYQRESAVNFLTAMTAYQMGASKMLGYTVARAQHGSKEDSQWEYEAAQERMSGEKAARDALMSALSAASIYLPEAVARFALEAAGREMHWVEALSQHYVADAPDPGPNPEEVERALAQFRRGARWLLGVDEAE